MSVSALTAPLAGPTPAKPSVSATSPSGPCGAPMVAPGGVVRGPVLHIPDADLICIATGADPSTWVPVPLAAPAASRASLMSAAFAQNAVCAIGADGRGACRIADADLADRLKAVATHAALAWR